MDFHDVVDDQLDFENDIFHYLGLATLDLEAAARVSRHADTTQLCIALAKALSQLLHMVSKMENQTSAITSDLAFTARSSPGIPLNG